MSKKSIFTFLKFFGFGVLFSFILTVIAFFVLAYTKIMDITAMLFLGIEWLLIGILPSFLIGLWLMFSNVQQVTYFRLFIIAFILAIGFMLGFLVLINEPISLEFQTLIYAVMVIVILGIVAGLMAMASGFMTFRKAKS